MFLSAGCFVPGTMAVSPSAGAEAALDRQLSITDAQASDEVAARITDRHFYWHRHRMIPVHFFIRGVMRNRANEVAFFDIALIRLREKEAA
ncbi:MAG TPA: hypothetical protein VM639_10900 [Dongiaceae bacterium]|nr:hypothetical protein [Dongiaceae bacterium]